jgi:type II secretory pathway pseudopilin PulG
MELHGQERTRSARGYAMAALLVALAVMAILLTVAMPVWKTAVKREKEAELIWRAGQYVRAIMLFRRKYANASPPNLDILINERFLRKKYKDPMTKDGEFQLVYAADQQQPPPGQVSNPSRASRLDPRTQGPAGAARGGIVGVVSKSTEPSLRVFNGRSKYSEWAFTPETLGIRMQGGANPPGGPVPGGAAGAVGPGGRPLAPSAPGRGGPPGPQRPFGLPPQRPPG